MKVTMGQDLFELYKTGNSKRYKDVSRNPQLRDGFTRAVEFMKAAESVEQLKGASFLHYEQLKYQNSGISSVRLSNSYVHRLLFTENETGIELTLIEIDDTHYGNKK
ncbi:MAG: hypothetical protein IKZ50_05395 [Bacteroidales bacterium]|nr:hypothetical protein [Bacteroidales bacterium]